MPRSPLAGAACVWFQTVVQVWRGPLQWSDDITAGSTESVLVDDDSVAVVEMRDAQVAFDHVGPEWRHEPPQPREPPGAVPAENLRKFLASAGIDLRYHEANLLEPLLSMAVPGAPRGRYREVVLREGDQVAVLGEATQVPDPTAHAGGFRVLVLRMAFGESPAGVLIGKGRPRCGADGCGMAADDEPADELLAARATPIARVQSGDRVKVVGGLLRANGVTFTAPLSGATCIWYFTQAQTWDKTRWSQQAVTERRTPDVLLADETGSALIRTAGCRVPPGGFEARLVLRAATPVGRSQHGDNGERQGLHGPLTARRFAISVRSSSIACCSPG